MKKVEYFFDFLSPYSFFSWPKLKELKNELKEKAEFLYYPVSLGMILKHWGQKGPGEIQPKRNYLYKNCLRYASRNKIQFSTPKVLPFNSLYALRLCLMGVAGNDQERIIDAIWEWGWKKGEDIGSPEVLVQILQSLNLDEDFMERIYSKSAKEELRYNIQKAIKNGVFGVPTYLVGEELFWGNDSFGDLKDYILGKDPMKEDDFQIFLKKHHFLPIH